MTPTRLAVRAALLLALLRGAAGAQDLDLVLAGSRTGADPFRWDELRNVAEYNGTLSDYALLAVRENPAMTPAPNDYGLSIVRLLDPANPVQCRFLSFQNNLTVNKNPHDVRVQGGLIYMTAGQGGMPAGKGLVIIPISGSGESGNPPCVTLGNTLIVNDVPNAKNLDVVDEGSSRTIYLANDVRESPTCVPGNLGVFLYRVTTSPSLAATRLGQWRTDTDAFTDDACAPCDSLCAPESVLAADRAGRRLLFVATFKNGIHVVDATSPASPVTVAHFRYTWSQGDRDGDTQPDLCDITGDGAPDDIDGDTAADDYCPTRTLDLALSGDGEILYTTDQFRYGGHLIGWRVADILTACGNPASPCAVDDPRVPKLFEYRATDRLPASLGSLHRSGPFLHVSAFDDGARILDLTDPAAPAEIARYDTLPEHPPGLADGVLGCYDAFPGRNFLLVSDIGAFDPVGSFSPSGGGLFLLRYTGGPDPARELRVSKRTAPSVDGTLLLDWGPVPFGARFNVYRGTIRAFRTEPDHYDHGTVAGCDLAARSATLPAEFTPGAPDPADSSYYLVQAENPRGDRGHLGRDSSGALRPDAAPPCP